MQNKDFRSRLRNHTSSPNSDAWEQMSQMLDSIPQQNKSKKKRRWLWLLLLPLCLGVTGYLMLSNDLSINSVNSQDKYIVEHQSNAQHSTNTNIKKGDQTASSQKAADITQREETRSTSLGNATPTILEMSTSASQPSGKNIIKNKKPNLNSKPRIDSDRADSFTTAREVQSTTQDTSEQKELGQSSPRNNMTTNLSNDGKDAKDGTTSLTTIEITKDQSQDKTLGAQEQITTGTAPEKTNAFINIDYLERVLMTIAHADRQDLAIPSIINNTPSNFWYAFGAGYARFNGNRGFILTGSVKYELDKILEFEGAIAYSYGSDQTQKVGEAFEFENQIDFNLNAHLNLINKRKGKIAFVGGIGLTKYSGQRVINIPAEFNNRASTGLNFTIALDLQYNLGINQAIGVRTGIIAFDDAVEFIAPYFLTRF